MRRGDRNNIIQGRFGSKRSDWSTQCRYIFALFAGAAFLGTVYGAGWLDGIWNSGQVIAADSAPMTGSTRFGYCHVGGGFNCVVDGDTIWLEGVKIRIANIDAPETHDYRCVSERELGDRATQRLHDILESGPITLGTIDRDEDVYGRKLRTVFVNGTNVGDVLVGDGLARYYGNGRRPWC